MTFVGKTALITGGGSGIGLAMAKRFANAGAHVIICGRRPEALDEARKQIPGLSTIACDVSVESEREALARRLETDHPGLDILLNNAGIQNRPGPLTQPQDWSRHKLELATNLEAPMHLTMLLIPRLVQRPEAAIINVTSGLAFVPIAMMPTYCLTKAAMHSFSLSVRKQLEGTSVTVIEMAPPAVQTDLGGKGLHDFGVPLEEYADFAMRSILAGEEEFGYQFSEVGRTATFEEKKAIFERMNAPH